MVRYEGVEERRKDWMTVLTRFDTETTERSPLSNLLETIIQADGVCSSRSCSSHVPTGRRKHNDRKAASSAVFTQWPEWSSEVP